MPVNPEKPQIVPELETSETVLSEFSQHTQLMSIIAFQAESELESNPKMSIGQNIMVHEKDILNSTALLNAWLRSTGEEI